MKMGRKTYERLFFSFMRLCSKSPLCNLIPVVSKAAVFLKKTVIKIARHGQKTFS